MGVPDNGVRGAGRRVIGKLSKPSLHRRGLRLKVGDGLRNVPRRFASGVALEVAQHSDRDRNPTDPMLEPVALEYRAQRVGRGGSCLAHGCELSFGPAVE
jgi:hypothetical protein